MATPEQEEKWHNDPKNWKFLGIYYNTQDARVFVPKRVKWMGITLNFANPKSYIALVIIVAFFWFIVQMISKYQH